MLTIFKSATNIVAIKTKVKNKETVVCIYIPKLEKRYYSVEKTEKEFHTELREQIEQVGDMLYEQSDNL
jgi:hypothetical protein